MRKQYYSFVVDFGLSVEFVDNKNIENITRLVL